MGKSQSVHMPAVWKDRWASIYLLFLEVTIVGQAIIFLAERLRRKHNRQARMIVQDNYHQVT